MAGEFVGELATFIATWEAAGAKLGRLRLPPPAATPVLAAEVAGGGAIPVALEGVVPAAGVRVGGPSAVWGQPSA